MRTNKFKYVAMGLLALGMTSCGDSFLDTNSKTDLNSTSFYKNEVQANYALIGCYDTYQRTVSNGSWPSLFQAVETMSDDCLGGGGPDDRSDRLMDRFDMTYKSDATSLFNGIWVDYYKAIYNANNLIGSIESISWTSDKSKATLSGEVRALRGLEYFDLVRMFERVPLLTTASTEIVPQAEPDSVYAQIVSDFTYAIENIPSSANKEESSLGHITKYAAEAMLARVYLFYDGVYNNNTGATMPGGLTKAQALAYCEDVITNGGYSLETDFKNLWPAASTSASTAAEGRVSTYKEASNEIVWVLKFNNTDSYTQDNTTKIYTDGNCGNRFIINFGLRNVGYSGEYAPYGYGWGACPITPYAQSLFNSSDSRGVASIINCTDIGAYILQSESDAMDYTGFVNKKYCPMVFSDGSSMPLKESDVTNGDYQLQQDENWILMRYADVLLMAAELGSPNATTYFNQVRERAYGNKSYDISGVPTTQQIWNERRLEFMGEGVRYFDLRRQGMDAFVAAQLGQAYSNGTTSGTEISVYNNRSKETIAQTYLENNIRAKRGFFQIPYDQITLSGGVYTKNAGW